MFVFIFLSDYTAERWQKEPYFYHVKIALSFKPDRLSILIEDGSEFFFTKGEWWYDGLTYLFVVFLHFTFLRNFICLHIANDAFIMEINKIISNMKVPIGSGVPTPEVRELKNSCSSKVPKCQSSYSFKFPGGTKCLIFQTTLSEHTKIYNQ